MDNVVNTLRTIFTIFTNSFYVLFNLGEKYISGHCVDFMGLKKSPNFSLLIQLWFILCQLL